MMLTGRKPRSNSKSTAGNGASAPARRARMTGAGATQRKVDKIIKRRASALRKLD